jgi:[ribosomal protein S5]-alanine N-acetyltransferase
MNLAAVDAIIRTERLELRPAELDDAQAIFDALAFDPRVTKFMEWRPWPQFDESKAAERHADLVSDMAEGKRILWVVRKLDEAAICGRVELRIDGRDGDIGYILASSHWGQGIMPEAVNAVLEFARRLGLRRVTGTCDPENYASVRVFEKLGFTYTGRQKSALVRPNLSDEPRDSECYELLLD